MRNDACHDNRERDATFGTKHFHYTTEVLYEMNGVREGSHFRLRIILRSHIEFKDWKVFRFLILCPILKRQECVLILHRTKEKKIKAKNNPQKHQGKVSLSLDVNGSLVCGRCDFDNHVATSIAVNGLYMHSLRLRYHADRNRSRTV